jgi:hypothetical protein
MAKKNQPAEKAEESPSPKVDAAESPASELTGIEETAAELSAQSDDCYVEEGDTATDEPTVVAGDSTLASMAECLGQTCCSTDQVDSLKKARTLLSKCGIDGALACILSGTTNLPE